MMAMLDACAPPPGLEMHAAGRAACLAAQAVATAAAAAAATGAQATDVATTAQAAADAFRVEPRPPRRRARGPRCRRQPGAANPRIMNDASTKGSSDTDCSTVRALDAYVALEIVLEPIEADPEAAINTEEEYGKKNLDGLNKVKVNYSEIPKVDKQIPDLSMQRMLTVPTSPEDALGKHPPEVPAAGAALAHAERAAQAPRHAADQASSDPPDLGPAQLSDQDILDAYMIHRDLSAVPTRLWASKEFVMEFARVSPYGVLHLASEKLRHDRELVLEAVNRDGTELELAAEELRTDREVVRAAVKQNALALQYAAPHLRK